MTASLSSLFTPCLVLDEAVMQRNIDTVADRAGRLGVTLRPHFKTAKCIEVAKRQLHRNARGLTVSTLREAQFCLDHGVVDLFYAVELAPSKTEAICRLIGKGADLKCLVDSPDAAEAIAARAGDTTVPLLISMDMDGYRCGIPGNGAGLKRLANYIHGRANLRFSGLMAYSGASYGLDSAAEKGRLLEDHLGAALAARSTLGIECPTLSIGSTPAFMNAERLLGATEVRAGIYVFQDLFQAGRGHCGVSDIALSVLTRVISVQPERNRFFVDAGGLAMSKDRSTRGYGFDAGYGALCDAGSGELIDDLVIREVHQEHGVVSSRSGKPVDFSGVTIDRMYRVLPNHSDMTAAAFDKYFVIDGQGDVVDVWPRANGWEPES
ncbi:MAG: alanine racemase [Gammaproteobacteria bacterium]|nr:alanine racemase [Gammaproteobacteria bacterium]MDE0366115.1 alanine racemase [Gammaproteobacteria bacterium]